jgi:cell division protein FtsL
VIERNGLKKTLERKIKMASAYLCGAILLITIVVCAIGYAAWQYDIEFKRTHELV